MNAFIKKYMPLSQVAPGRGVTIAELNGGEQFKQKMISLGMIPDTHITVEHCQGCDGPMAVKIHQTKLMIGRGMADKISVIPD